MAFIGLFYSSHRSFLFLFYYDDFILHAKNFSVWPALKYNNNEEGQKPLSISTKSFFSVDNKGIYFNFRF